MHAMSPACVLTEAFLQFAGKWGGKGDGDGLFQDIYGLGTTRDGDIFACGKAWVVHPNRNVPGDIAREKAIPAVQQGAFGNFIPASPKPTQRPPGVPYPTFTTFPRCPLRVPLCR